MWWCIHVHTMTSQGRNLETETFIASSILRTAWQSTVAASSWTEIQVGFSRIVEGIALIEVADMSGTLFFSQSNADVSWVCTHICWVLDMTALPVEKICGVSRHSDIMLQLQGVGLFLRMGLLFFFFNFIYLIYQYAYWHHLTMEYCCWNFC